MKVVILAGGYATRLHPITLDQPKPLLKVADKPIVEHITDKLQGLEVVDEIFVVTNQKFFLHFLEWNNSYNSRKRIKIINDLTTSNEDRLGSIGDINFVIQQENLKNDLLIIGGDNLFEDNLNNFINHFQQHGSTILVNDVKSLERAKLFGIVTRDDNNIITEFIEKPENPSSTLSATLIYAIKKDHIFYINQTIQSGFSDRAGDFIKHLSQNESVSALTLNGRWFDIGTLELLNEANEVYQNEN
ncbi:nucleotidyltransferase family protein [Candidatus Woesearchaeota archaeon]|nr:nucleotidyltransferase family protein [Candidatus Woesearchaeota archaeon]